MGIQPVNPKGNWSWIVIERTDAEAETPILWPHDMKNWLTGKYSDIEKDWGSRRRGWHKMSWLDGITNLVDISLSKLWELVMDVAMGVTKRWTRLSDWTYNLPSQLNYTTVTYNIHPQCSFPGAFSRLVKSFSCIARNSTQTGLSKVGNLLGHSIIYPLLGNQLLPGTSPSWIQGIRSVDDVGDERIIYLEI